MKIYSLVQRVQIAEDLAPLITDIWHLMRRKKKKSNNNTKGDLVIKSSLSKARLVLPILHAGPHALVAGGWHALDRELPKTACHHGNSSELATRAGVWAAGVLPVQTLVCAAAHRAVIRAHERHLHPDPGRAVRSQPAKTPHTAK